MPHREIEPASAAAELYSHATIPYPLAHTVHLTASGQVVISSSDQCDGGGSFLACEQLGRIFDHSFPACAFFFFFEVKISSRTLIPVLCQDQSTVGRPAEKTVAECSLRSCVRARFRICSHALPGQQHSKPHCDKRRE